MTKDSEKITDHNMLSKFEKVFNDSYNTLGNNKLFGFKIPDGWYEFENKLLIIENKKNLKDKRKGLEQLLNYYLVASKTEEFKKYKQCFLILGCGTSKDFKYWIYSMDNNNIKETKYKLKDLKTKDYKPLFDLKEIHEFNQYLYNCGINLPKNQKTLFVAAILLCLKINPKFLISYDENDKGFIIADHMLKLINDYYKDPIFTKSFEFIKVNLNNEHLFYLINIVSIDVKKYGIDILKQFYNEFMIYDKNNDSACGIVLTPHDIVELMVKSLNIKKGESVADFCTGTGSFLVEASKYTNNLIGCENGEERYALAKCNFILKDLSIEHLYFNNCFNQQFESYDHIILNPPFSCNSSDNGEIKDLYGWRKLKNEQKFIIYQLQYLKDGGIGCCIIPRSNFNNSTSKTNNFKKILLDNCQIIKIINCNSKVFAPAANVECTICVFKKCKSSNFETNIIDYSDDGYTVKKNIRLKTSEPNPKSYKTVLKLNEDWNYVQPLDVPDNLEQLIKLYNLNYIYCQEQNKLMLANDSTNNLNIKTKEIKLNELLEPLKLPTFSNNEESGDIPLYGATQEHKPTAYINKCSLNTDESEDLNIALNGVFLINKTGNGGAGICFKHKGKFAINGTVSAFKMKIFIDDQNTAFISHQLHKKLNRANSLSLEKFNNLKVKIIINGLDKTDENYINIDKYKDEIIKLGEVKKYDKIKIGDYFDFVKNYKTFQVQNSEDGEYPLITRSALNNGITKYINDYSLDGEYLTIAPSGSSGSTFYHNGKFAVDKMLKVLKLKKDKNLDLKLFALMANYYLTKKYNYNNGLTEEKIKNEIINYPISEK